MNDKAKKVWPEGTAVDFAFWKSHDLWMICDAAAIVEGYDPRCFILKSADPAYSNPEAPKFAINDVPGVHTRTERIAVMAKNGLIKSYKDGVNDEASMFWYVEPREIMERYGLLEETGEKIKLGCSHRTAAIIIKALLYEAGIGELAESKPTEAKVKDYAKDLLDRIAALNEEHKGISAKTLSNFLRSIMDTEKI